jgi:heme a synthase
MYMKLVLITCVLAFIAVVFSAYARLSDAGLGCANWPACYEENALKQRKPPNHDADRSHTAWQWKLQNQVGLLLGILSVSICGISWKRRREFQQSPMLPTLLVGLMVFLGVFGVLAFSYLPRPIIVLVHLAGGITMLILLTRITLSQIAPTEQFGAGRMRSLYVISSLGVAIVLAEVMLGGWVSSNFAGLACTEFPLCQGSLLPAMDFSYSLEIDGMPLSHERLTAIHWIHRIGALLTLAYLSWLSFRANAVRKLKYIGRTVLVLVVIQFGIGVINVKLGLPLAGAVLHNAVAMILIVMLLILNYKVQKR